MASKIYAPSSCLFLLIMIISTGLIGSGGADHGNSDHGKSYIVYMGNRHEGGEAAAQSLHLNMLQQAIGR
ncbi:unnamed protein product [Linum tenue]|uniref:Uncharacterized protein n=1 Tax=Linum tenue TaxID=586396 RepID=A0AAV0MD50_9ROSI|nr:unnamed protein product [Linum tenue]CAI0447380.1 unnamed protein product [Linum tenue]